MLAPNMILRKMIDFRPSDLDMAMLDLDVVVYCKVALVSLSKEDNYGFIRHLFSDDDISFYFKNYADTVFYDFDGRHTDQEKFITIFEMYSLYNYDNTSEYLKDILELYTHEADVLIDLYTHDSKAYRLSNLDGIVKLEEMSFKNAA
ncbi:MAG: hypothetical protein IJI44_07295 [Erysipelotrichaceae bacterium]|nr:hypothetical protein [Erysipelotrichaceae bacterium]